MQARMGSTRLPGKVMKDLCGNPVLWHVVHRLKFAKKVDEVVVACTTQRQDDVIDVFCAGEGIRLYRGSTDDVLSRYFESARAFQAQTVVRITSDCPVIDPQIVDKIVSEYNGDLLAARKSDYVSNTLERTFPRGLDVEVFSFDVLSQAHRDARQSHEREHVTPYIYEHPGRFVLKNFKHFEDLSSYRLTLDTQEDYALLSQVYSLLFQGKRIFLLDEIMDLLRNRPELASLNRHIEQKHYK